MRTTSDPGSAPRVRVSNDLIDVSGSMYAAAVKFVFEEEDALADFQAFATSMVGPDVQTTPADCTQAQFDEADADADSDVDLADFAEFQVAFTD